MASSLALAHRVPYTTKQPARCPHCGSARLIRKGTRRKKLEIAQLWQCKLCRRVFTPAPPALRYKTYPLRVILDGVTLYNLGYSLPVAAQKLKAKHGYKVAPSTLSSWMDEHRELTTYRRLREQARGNLSPAQTVRSSKLYHRQVYSFAYHRPKLALLRESRQHQRFAPLADFLEQAPKNCPHDLFSDGSRASQLPNFVNRNHLIVVEKENFATRTAALVIPSVGDNRLRHETLQRFILANDSVTVAVEIPIWLLPQDIDALETEYGIRLLPEGHEPRILTGHIDFLQVRNGAVHILDYKPDARTNQPIAQLTLYALALTRLAGLRLFDIKCAWFNEETYCEFFPRALLAR
jgi:transposase-like protein